MGMTEREAREAGIDVRTVHLPLRDSIARLRAHVGLRTRGRWGQAVMIAGVPSGTCAISQRPSASVRRTQPWLTG